MPMGHGWSTPPEYDEEHGWSCCGAKGGHRRDCPLWKPGEPVGEGGWEPVGFERSEPSRREPLPGADSKDPWRTYKEDSSQPLGDNPRFRGDYWTADELRAHYEAGKGSSDASDGDPWLAVAELEQRWKREFPGPTLADWRKVAAQPPDECDPDAWHAFVMEKRQELLHKRYGDAVRPPIRGEASDEDGGVDPSRSWFGKAVGVLFFGGFALAIFPATEELGVTLFSVAVAVILVWGVGMFIASEIGI